MNALTHPADERRIREIVRDELAAQAARTASFALAEDYAPVIYLPAVINRRPDEQHGDCGTNQEEVPNGRTGTGVGESQIDHVDGSVSCRTYGRRDTLGLLGQKLNRLARVVQNVRRLATNLNAVHSSPSSAGSTRVRGVGGPATTATHPEWKPRGTGSVGGAE